MSVKRLGRQKGYDFPTGLSLGGYGTYKVNKSLRFRASASAYLNRSPSSSSDRQKFTISAWIKKSQFGSYQGFVQATCPNPPFADSFDGLHWNSSDQLEFCARGGRHIFR